MKIYEDSVVKFEVQQARDRLGYWLSEFQLDPDIAILGVGRIILRLAPVSCDVKE